MFWIKVGLAVLIAAFCTALGYFAAGKYRARKLFYSEFTRFNERYLSELGYERRQLSAFLREGCYHGDFQNAVEGFCEKRSVFVGYSFLSKEERVETERYFQQLGRGDSRTQSAFFTSQKARLEQKREEAEREAKVRSELYLKLGLLAGLAFVVLIL